jgi:hypothetical protein
MRIHFLVEGSSDEILIEGIFHRMCPGHSCKIYPHQGKGSLPGRFDEQAPKQPTNTLLDNLPFKLKALDSFLSPETERVVVLVDVDNQETYLRQRFSELETWLSTLTIDVIVCFAIEESEAFLMGDWRALVKAFPKASKKEHNKYQQDSICGTWEILQKVIKSPFENKTHWAREISPHMNTSGRGKFANRSPSFQAFRKNVRQLCGES